MARWGKSSGRRITPPHRSGHNTPPVPAEPSEGSDRHDDPSAPMPERPQTEPLTKAMRAVAADAVRDLPAVAPDEQERRARLLTLTVKAPNPEIARAAVEAAATARCLVPFTCLSTDRNGAAAIARFLVWTAYPTGVVDLRRGFRRRNVDRYLMSSGTGAERGLRERRNILYGTGRVLHPREYPPARVLPAPRPKRQAAATPTEIRDLMALIPRLPEALATRAQVLFDLSYGAGARPADFKTLRGTAITTTRSYGRAFSVVTLPNNAGGVRQVPVIDSAISARLLELSARVGSGLVLAPDAEFAERNIVNRISERMRARGYPGFNVAALRNRWVLDLAERIPAALLVQLADLVDVRVLADQRDQLRRYKPRHTITLMMEAWR